MKKLLCIILTLIFVFALSACGGSTGNTKETTLPTELTTIGTEANSAPTTSAEATVAQTSKPQTTVNAEPVEVEMLPEEVPAKFIFASGAGAWACGLNLNHDGSFEGTYHNSDMGDSGEDYPYGTRRDCIFDGRFENLVKVNDYTYSMTLAEVNTDKPIGEEKIEDGFRTIVSEPWGIYNGEKFILYLPQTPVSELSEEFLRWCPYIRGEDIPDTLSCYGILNVNEQIGFFCEE